MTEQLYPETETGRIVFPEKTIRLLGGRTVLVRPWGMATGRRLAPRVAALAQQLRGFSLKDLSKLVVEAQAEVYDIIKHTLGWTDAQMDELAYEDLFTLAGAVVDVCIIRPGADGGGVAGKLLALGGLTPEQLVARVREELARSQQKKVIDESLKRSSSSSPPDTPPPESEITPSTS